VAIKIIQLSRLETELRKTLSECVDSGSTLVVELPGQRFVSIQPLESSEDDDLTNQLIESNPSFRALLERSKASPRKSFDLS